VRRGERLAEESPVEADLVMPIPDSGTPAAIGFSRATNIPFSEGLIKNRYVGRTFIQPDQGLREQGIRLKFNPLAEVAGKRVVAVDDSIVRGNTTRQIVGMLRDAGAREVHLRISAPPIRNPCHYGVDMSTREEMIAHKRTIDEIAEELDADSLAYLSMDGVYEAIGGGPEDHCDACFSGNYPLGDPEDANGKFALEDVAVVPTSG
jgi:amidophosphoribosyltransferase